MIALASVAVVNLIQGDNSQTATVTLAADIDDVYEAIQLETSGDAILNEDKNDHQIQVQRGEQIYLIRATAVDDNATEMAVTVEEKDRIKGDPAITLAQEVCHQLETECELKP